MKNLKHYFMPKSFDAFVYLAAYLTVCTPHSSKLNVTTFNFVVNTIYPSTVVAKVSDCFLNRSINFSVI